MTDGDAQRLERVTALITERADLPGLKVLDLACRTGTFTTALADAGADVLGIEGRPENLAQAPTGRARYELGDVRDLHRRTDRFDIILCLGILYHLEPQAALRLLAAMRKLTERFAIVDTHIGTDSETIYRGGHWYRGSWYDEPDGPWSAINNPRSFWFTETSLERAISNTGWDKIEHVPGPGWPGEAADRRWLVIS